MANLKQDALDFVAPFVPPDIGQQLFEQGDPLRQLLFDRSEAFFQGGEFDVRGSPLFLQRQQAVNRQFQGARRGITETLPAGGALLEALAGLETNRARELVDVEGNLITEEFNRAFSLATGQPLVSAVEASTARDERLALEDAAREARKGEEVSAFFRGLGTFVGGK